MKRLIQTVKENFPNELAHLYSRAIPAPGGFTWQHVFCASWPSQFPINRKLINSVIICLKRKGYAVPRFKTEEKLRGIYLKEGAVRARLVKHSSLDSEEQGKMYVVEDLVLEHFGPELPSANHLKLRTKK